LPPIHGRQVRESGPGFSSGHPARAKRRCHPWQRPLRGLSTPTHRRTGDPGKAAGPPGPHSGWSQGKNNSASFFANPQPFSLSVGRRPKSKGSRQPHPSTSPLRGYAQGDRRRDENTESRMPPRSRHGNAAAYRVRATMARRSTRGPSAAAGGRRISPQGGRQGCRPVWRQSMDGLSTNPVARPRTLRAGCPQGAEAGWPSLLVTFLLATQEKSDSSAVGDRKLLL
jgi:hypothetical protein